MRQWMKSAVVVLMLVALGVAVLPPTATGDDLLLPSRIEQGADTSDDTPWNDGTEDPGSAPGLFRAMIIVAFSVYDAIYVEGAADVVNQVDKRRRNVTNVDVENVTTLR